MSRMIRRALRQPQNGALFVSQVLNGFAIREREIFEMNCTRCALENTGGESCLKKIGVPHYDERQGGILYPASALYYHHGLNLFFKQPFNVALRLSFGSALCSESIQRPRLSNIGSSAK